MCIVWRFLKKLKIELPYDPAIPLLGRYPKQKTKSVIQKDTCIPMFKAALFIIAKIQAMDKEYTHTHTHTHTLHIYEYPSAIKKHEILPFATTYG